MTQLLSVLALVATGSMVGVELSVATWVNAVFDRLPSNAGLLGRSDSARVLGRVMPFWYGASILTAVLVAVLLTGAARWTAVGAAALLVGSIAMSVLLLVPINDRAKTWTPDNAPQDWREQLHRWDYLHRLRLAVIVTGFVLLAWACIR